MRRLSSGLAAPSVEYLGWGAHFFDADSDGDLDLFSVNSHVYPQVDQASTGGGYAQRNQLFRNDGGSYVEVDGGPGLAVKAVSRGTASGDYDGDGDIDLLVTNLDQAPTLLRNDTETSNGHIAVDLLGKGLNRHGVGAQVGVRVNGQTLLRTVNSGSGYLGANALRLHFGLGERTEAEWVSVRWPGGACDTVYAVAAGAVLRLSEGGEN